MFSVTTVDLRFITSAEAMKEVMFFGYSIFLGWIILRNFVEGFGMAQKDSRFFDIRK